VQSGTSEGRSFMNNRFEQNGGAGGIGIRILNTVTKTRMHAVVKAVVEE
jgi:hypothetical protein